MSRYLYILMTLSLLVPLVLFAQEEGISCAVSPYSQTVEEGRAATYSISFSGFGTGDASRAVLGGLPGGVTGRFEGEDTLVINALAGAQLGSFDVSILYDVQDVSSLLQTACSFNLVVEAGEGRDKTQDYIPLPSHIQQMMPVIEKGVITAEPETIDKEQGSAEGPFVSPLYRGLQNEEVRALQALLKDTGYFPAWVDTTGYYGPITEAAVAEFQQEHNIPSLGFVGPLTRVQLNERVQDSSPLPQL